MNFLYSNQDYFLVNKSTLKFLVDFSLVDLKELLIDQNVLELQSFEDDFSLLSAKLSKEARVLFLNDEYIVETDISYIFTNDRRNVHKITIPAGFSSKVPVSFANSARTLSECNTFLIWKIFFDFVWTSDSMKHYNESVKNLLILILIVSVIQQNIIILNSELQNTIPYLCLTEAKSCNYSSAIMSTSCLDKTNNIIGSSDDRSTKSVLRDINDNTMTNDSGFSENGILISKLRTDTIKANLHTPLEGEDVFNPDIVPENEAQTVSLQKNSKQIEDTSCTCITDENIQIAPLFKADRSLVIESSPSGHINKFLNMDSTAANYEQMRSKAKNALQDEEEKNSYKFSFRNSKDNNSISKKYSAGIGNVSINDESNNNNSAYNDALESEVKTPEKSDKNDHSNNLFPTKVFNNADGNSTFKAVTSHFEGVQDVLKFVIENIISNDLFSAEGYYETGRIESKVYNARELLDFERCKGCETFIIKNIPYTAKTTSNMTIQQNDFSDTGIIYSIEELRKAQQKEGKKNYLCKTKDFFITVWQRITCHSSEQG